MAAYRALMVDGFDLSTLDFRVQSMAGHRNMPEATWPNAPVPGRYGPVLLSYEAQRQARPITVRGVFDSTSLVSLYANMDAAKARMDGALRTYTVVDNEAREHRAYLLKWDAQGLPPELATPRTYVTLTLWCPDPRAYSTVDTVVNFGATATDTPLGTAPTHPVIRVAGAASAPALVYKSSTGGERGRVTLNTTLSSTDWVDIDMGAGTLLNKAGASVSAVYATTVSGFFALDPLDGTYWSSGWPTVEVSVGSGTATYRKAWL